MHEALRLPETSKVVHAERKVVHSRLIVPLPPHHLENLPPAQELKKHILLKNPAGIPLLAG